jgi:hypothetical protein
VKSNQILLVVELPPEVIDDPGVAGYLRPDVAASGRF